MIRAVIEALGNIVLLSTGILMFSYLQTGYV
jgi:hypothetical protein